MCVNRRPSVAEGGCCERSIVYQICIPFIYWSASYYFVPGAECCDQHICMRSVCLSVAMLSVRRHISETTHSNVNKLSLQLRFAGGPWPWLCPPLAALQLLSTSGFVADVMFFDNGSYGAGKSHVTATFTETDSPAAAPDRTQNLMSVHCKNIRISAVFCGEFFIF